MKRLGIFLGIIILLSLISQLWYSRVDLTEGQRYSLSAQTNEVLALAEDPLVIDVFLGGELPAEFRKLREETKNMLEELAQIHPNLTFEFIEPLKDLNQDEAQQVTQQLARNGVKAAMATINQGGKSTNVRVFPYAIVLYQGKRTAIQLLQSVGQGSSEDRVNASIQQLEYQLIDGIRKVALPKEKRIAVLKDSGELEDLKIADLLLSLQQYYYTGKYGVEYVTTSDETTPQQVLEQLKGYDLVLEAKPTVAFSETKNYILDQYLMSGGNIVLAVDPIIMENDSLSNAQRRAYPLPRDLNLDNLLFSYGLRLNNGLIKSLDFAPIALAVGQGRNTQYEAFPWPYYPVSSESEQNEEVASIITKNLSPVRFEYAGSIDTLRNGVQKTILLASGEQSQVVSLPAAVSLADIEQPLDPEEYLSGRQSLAVLAQGEFTSAYRNKVKPFDYSGHQDRGKPGNILLIADGDVLKNQVDRGQPQDLGYDLRTGMLYGNKEFLLNSIELMLDGEGLIALRNKDITIPFLNLEESYGNRSFWQSLNLGLPLVILGVVGAGFVWWRKRRYAI